MVFKKDSSGLGVDWMLNTEHTRQVKSYLYFYSTLFALQRHKWSWAWCFRQRKVFYFPSAGAQRHSRPADFPRVHAPFVSAAARRSSRGSMSLSPAEVTSTAICFESKHTRVSSDRGSDQRLQLLTDACHRTDVSLWTRVEFSVSDRWWLKSFRRTLCRFIEL